MRERNCVCVCKGQRGVVMCSQNKRPTSHPSTPSCRCAPLSSPVSQVEQRIKRGSDWMLNGGWKEEEEDRLSSWTLMNISGSGPSPADFAPEVSRADSRTGVWIGFAPRDALLRSLYINRRATLRRRHAPPLLGRRDHRGVTRISDAASAGPLWCLRVTTTRTWLKHAGK